jgi:hypothetical protein
MHHLTFGVWIFIVGGCTVDADAVGSIPLVPLTVSYSKLMMCESQMTEVGTMLRLMQHHIKLCEEDHK